MFYWFLFLLLIIFVPFIKSLFVFAALLVLLLISILLVFIFTGLQILPTISTRSQKSSLKKENSSHQPFFENNDVEDAEFKEEK